MSDTRRMNRKWVIEFWDHGAWNIGAYGSWDKKTEAIAVCERMNRATPHCVRAEVYDGHRFRVRINPDRKTRGDRK